jgi:MFS family permease
MSPKGTTTRLSSAQRWVLALVSLASLMVVLDMLVVTTALNTIRLDLGATIEGLEWTITAFTLSFAVLLMPAAAFGDRLGRRRVFNAGLGLFTLASAACALAPDTGTLIAARTVQGIGSAMIMPHAVALLSVAVAPEQRAKALGVFSSVTGVGILGGPLIGGAITQGLDWQWIFWLNVPIGVVLLPLCRARLQESTGAARKLDYGGLVLGVLVTIAFVVWEIRTPEPMLPMRFFRAPAFSAGNAVGFLLYGCSVGGTFFLAQYLQTTMLQGPLGAGIRLIPWTAAVFVVSPIAGSLVNRTGERVLTMMAAGFGWIAFVARPDVNYAVLIAPLLLAGCGISLAMPSAQNAVIGAVPPAAVGAAAGTFNTMRQFGGTFGIAIVAAVFAGSGSYASPQAFNDGFVPAIAVAACLSLAAAIAGLWTPGRPARPAPVLVTENVASPQEAGT